ncbi:class I SAM-dependent methyltransferase [Geomonas sp. RF6]|uniref:class I SAM-dependent methyltransferase n=1 Tax=Geomonas sp. RF6 TaxID=2897342 RepID=UPI001E524714|nr:class I SAM-dependent methyltransferase [Geomonas sp. RF6]UFS70059.1 class I SAM-dependent methyltransferase [Geomonas sp. RF6]
MTSKKYIMEGSDESKRLDVKTDNAVTERQALWAGIAPGMRVADIGCGAGKTTYKLHELVQPGGSALGIDIAEQRVSYASANYGDTGATFVCRDARQPLDDLGTFDFIWVRFLLEYYRAESFQMVQNISRMLKPGGTLLLIDLDHNCLCHYGLSERMDRAIHAVMGILESRMNFDPYVGRKLYSYLYDLGFNDIDVNVSAHHQIFGPLKVSDDFNWTKKVEVAARNSGYDFAEYPGGFEEFLLEFQTFFADPRRFTYTPIICCRGVKG